jgi:large subunit ribosomal protein L27
LGAINNNRGSAYDLGSANPSKAKRECYQQKHYQSQKPLPFGNPDLDFFYPILYHNSILMAKTKSGGSTKLGRDSAAKRLGVKIFAGAQARPGMVLVRQRGTKFWPGPGVRKGGDDTLYAAHKGIVRFRQSAKIKFDKSRHLVTIVEISQQ